MKTGAKESNNGWCFAMINGRLAEIYFDKKQGIYGHCYVQRKEYTKKEKKMIDSDILKYQFVYRKGCYTDRKRKIKQKAITIDKVFPEIRKYRLKKNTIKICENIISKQKSVF
ncbi:hypothetical protein KKB68_00195 [Patescibacteria group bacterium]|nr:hypothetical protein [Patescibacteria group bacterium]